MTTFRLPYPVEYSERRRALALLPQSPSDLPLPVGETFTEIVAVEDVCPPGAGYAPGAMLGLSLFLTLHGHTAVTVAGKTHLHQPGTFLTIAPGFDIEEQVSRETHWHVLFLMLSGPWADQFAAYLRAQERPVVVNPGASAHRRHIFTEMTELVLTQPTGWQWRFIGHGAELFGGLYAEAVSAFPGDALVRGLAGLIDAEPDARFTVAQLATSVNLTPRQLLYQFQKATGKPLALWIRERRIVAAQKLLGQGQSVSSVAAQLGFANPYHFSRVFKSVTGVAPSIISESALRAGLHS